MRETRGDIWDFYDERYYVVIPTNLGWRKDGSNVMGRGLAHQAAVRYPKLPEIYGAMCQEMAQENCPRIRFWGKLIFFPVKRLIPKFPHISWQPAADIDLIERSTKQLAAWAQLRSARIALPLVGCGNGKLPEELVVPLLRRYLSNNLLFILVKR